MIFGIKQIGCDLRFGDRAYYICLPGWCPCSVQDTIFFPFLPVPPTAFPPIFEVVGNSPGISDFSELILQDASVSEHHKKCFKNSLIDPCWVYRLEHCSVHSSPAKGCGFNPWAHT